MDISITTYAPVLIPTLNRYEHLKRCVESLEQCTGADKTHVYIAVDYPPSEKYVSGWKQICEYLKTKEKTNRFAHLHIILREKNYGVCHKDGNYETLIRDICERYDRYILSEDDNEFSACFLEFINKGLERFKDDDRITAVCGYNFPMEFPPMYRNNYYLTKRCCAWGIGEWRSKTTKVGDLYDFKVLGNLLRDRKTYNRIKDTSPRLISSIVSMIKYRRYWSDAIKEIYAIINDTYFLLPTDTLVRNHGNDGSGDHSKKKNEAQNSFYLAQNLKDEKYFNFSDDLFAQEPCNLERYKYQNRKQLPDIIKQIIKYLRFRFDLFMLLHFNYVPTQKYL